MGGSCGGTECQPSNSNGTKAPASPAPTRCWYGCSCRDGLRCELGHTYTGPEDVLPTSWRRLPSVPTRWICALGDTVSTMRRRTGVPMPTASKTSCARPCRYTGHISRNCNSCHNSRRRSMAYAAGKTRPSSRARPAHARQTATRQPYPQISVVAARAFNLSSVALCILYRGATCSGCHRDRLGTMAASLAPKDLPT